MLCVYCVLHVYVHMYMYMHCRNVLSCCHLRTSHEYPLQVVVTMVAAYYITGDVLHSVVSVSELTYVQYTAIPFTACVCNY